MKRMRSDTVWISRTVLLETEWVLRHAYGLDAAAIGKAFTTLLGVASVEMEDRAAVLRTLAWHGAGMAFADALHLAVSAEATAFVSFDRDLARVAKRISAKPEVSTSRQITGASLVDRAREARFAWSVLQSPSAGASWPCSPTSTPSSPGRSPRGAPFPATLERASAL